MDALDATEKVLIMLRDNRKITGVLRSYDQYGKFPSLLSWKDWRERFLQPIWYFKRQWNIISTASTMQTSNEGSTSSEARTSS
jgi:hypothetical protein